VVFRSIQVANEAVCDRRPRLTKSGAGPLRAPPAGAAGRAALSLCPCGERRLSLPVALHRFFHPFEVEADEAADPFNRNLALPVCTAD